MKTNKALFLVILAGALIASGAYAGTEIIEKQTVIQHRQTEAEYIPYGHREGVPVVDDDEITSPWSNYTVTASDDLGSGQVLIDPIVGRPFRVPE